MKRIGIAASILVLAGSLAHSAIAADDRLIVKEQLSDDDSYCHMRFRAIDEGTLASKRPQLKDASSGDVVDFYGPCDESPTGEDQVRMQRLEEAWHNPVSDE